MPDVQRIVRDAVYNMQIGTILARGQVPEYLPGRLLLGQEAAGVHGLPQGLWCMYTKWAVLDMSVGMDQEQKGSLYCQGERQL